MNDDRILRLEVEEEAGRPKRVKVSTLDGETLGVLQAVEVGWRRDFASADGVLTVGIRTEHTRLW